MLKQRVLTALILLPLMLGMLFFAGAGLWGVFCGIMTLIALWEYGRMVGITGQHLRAYVGGTGIFLGVALLGDWQLPVLVWRVVWLFWTVGLACWLFYQWSPKGLWAMAMGWLMLLPFWFGLLLLRSDDSSVSLFALMLLVWLADTGAYFAGRRWGKRPLAPSISPKKTWEGACGGLLAVWILAMFAHRYILGGAHSVWGIAFYTAVLTAVSIGGDLLESVLKRKANMKDSSQLLPGHGGVYDRIDSLIAVVSLCAASMV